VKLFLTTHLPKIQLNCSLYKYRNTFRSLWCIYCSEMKLSLSMLLLVAIAYTVATDLTAVEQDLQDEDPSNVFLEFAEDEDESVEDEEEEEEDEGIFPVDRMKKARCIKKLTKCIKMRKHKGCLLKKHKQVRRIKRGKSGVFNVKGKKCSKKCIGKGKWGAMECPGDAGDAGDAGAAGPAAPVCQEKIFKFKNSLMPGAVVVGNATVADAALCMEPCKKNAQCWFWIYLKSDKLCLFNKSADGSKNVTALEHHLSGNPTKTTGYVFCN